MGYILPYFIVGPLLMKKHNKRSLKESYLYFGNCLQIEHDLCQLILETNDILAITSLKAIKVSKLIILFCIPLFILFAILYLN